MGNEPTTLINVVSNINDVSNVESAYWFVVTWKNQSNIINIYPYDKEINARSYFNNLFYTSRTLYNNENEIENHYYGGSKSIHKEFIDWYNKNKTNQENNPKIDKINKFKENKENDSKIACCS